MPILTRAGCNAGGCHGKADGQNGFHLSLFGYDPEGDYQALTREAGGRRLSRLDPEASLLLRKATGRTPHGGGPRLAADSAEYRTLLAWIAAGAPERRGQTHGALVDARGRAGATSGSTSPGRSSSASSPATPTATRATSPGWRASGSLDDSAATVDPNGRAVLLRRAETDLIVRYQSQVVSARLATVDQSRPRRSTSRPCRGATSSTTSCSSGSNRCACRRARRPSDAAFLRRVSLDLTGQQPTPDQVPADSSSDTDPEQAGQARRSAAGEPRLRPVLADQARRPAPDQPGPVRQRGESYQTWLAGAPGRERPLGRDGPRAPDGRGRPDLEGRRPDQLRPRRPRPQGPRRAPRARRAGRRSSSPSAATS